MSTAAASAMQLGLQSCEACGLLSRPSRGGRSRPLPALRRGARRSASPTASQRTWAFLIAAAICYVPANLLPVMTTTRRPAADSDTIMQGVVLLWSPTGWPLSLIVLSRAS